MELVRQENLLNRYDPFFIRHLTEEEIMAGTEMEKIVVFEEINNVFISLVIRYLSDGYHVYFFHIDEKTQKTMRLQEAREKGKLIDLSKKIFTYTFFLDAGVLAHKYLEEIFSRYFACSKSIDICKKYFNSEEILEMYKKELLVELQCVYDKQLRINTISSSSEKEIIFHPAQHHELYSDTSVTILKKCKVIKTITLLQKICNLRIRLKECMLFFYPLLILLRKISWISFTKKSKKEYQFGINENLPELTGYNYHYIEYLVEERYGLLKNDYIFIDETAHATFSEITAKKGFATWNFVHGREKLSISYFCLPFLSRTVPLWIKNMIYSLVEDSIIVQTNRKVLTDIIKWSIFFDNYTLKNSITILLPDTISKSILLSKNGCRTWFIYPDNSAADYVSGYNESIPIATIHTFMRYDFAVVFGNKVKRYFSNNRNSIRQYIPVGVLASQQIRELKGTEKQSRLLKLIKAKNFQGKIVGVFDNSFADWAPNTIKDGIRFADEILMLLDENPGINVIFKEKKSVLANPELRVVYELLEKHPRCIIIRKTQDNCFFSTDVIAVSDLVISVAYTSTNAEALGAKVKCIYYNIAGRDIGEKYYFNNYPRFVAHNYTQLKNLVHYWLYEINDQQFEEFLDTYVKDEIDPYLDLKAIDRLHTFLRETND